MSPDLPPALRSAIDREMAGVSRQSMAERTAATTTAYRAGGTSASAIRGRDDALAYALARLPATYAACAEVFSEAGRMIPGFSPKSLLDAGCGPGGGSWAAREAWPDLNDVTWLDANPPFLELARRLGEARRLGFTRAVVPEGSVEPGEVPDGLALLQARDLAHALGLAHEARVPDRDRPLP